MGMEKFIAYLILAQSILFFISKSVMLSKFIQQSKANHDYDDDDDQVASSAKKCSKQTVDSTFRGVNFKLIFVVHR